MDRSAVLSTPYMYTICILFITTVTHTICKMFGSPFCSCPHHVSSLSLLSIYLVHYSCCQTHNFGAHNYKLWHDSFCCFTCSVTPTEQQNTRTPEHRHVMRVHTRDSCLSCFCGTSFVLPCSLVLTSRFLEAYLFDMVYLYSILLDCIS
jgi:hypothetical protein